jgi:hypothetical protein
MKEVATTGTDIVVIFQQLGGFAVWPVAHISETW